jgi:DNA mismatch repair protein MutS2
MASRFLVGDTVQTRLGKGVVREIRNGDRLKVDVQGRAMVVSENEITAVETARKRPRAPHASQASAGAGAKREARAVSAEIDLHGLTVEEALDRVQQALSDALLADIDELRLIHGRSGGRIRAALHRRLKQTPGVRKLRLDPRNEGVTIVNL